jgi:hypothetical protein
MKALNLDLGDKSYPIYIVIAANVFTMMPTAHAFLALRLSNFDKHTRTCFNASIIFFADWMNSDEKNDSIFLQEWYQVLDASYSNKAIDTARAINPFIRKQMEQMRHDKIIGSSFIFFLRHRP